MDDERKEMKSSTDKKEQSMERVCSSAKLSFESTGFGPISAFFTRVMSGTLSSMHVASLKGA